jgi:hypothetical protein
VGLDDVSDCSFNLDVLVIVDVLGDRFHGTAAPAMLAKKESVEGGFSYPSPDRRSLLYTCLLRFF